MKYMVECILRRLHHTFIPILMNALVYSIMYFAYRVQRYTDTVDRHHKQLCRPDTWPRSRRYRPQTTNRFPKAQQPKAYVCQSQLVMLSFNQQETAHGQTNAKDYKSIAAFPEVHFPCIQMYMCQRWKACIVQRGCSADVANGVEGLYGRDDGIETIGLPAPRACTMAVPLPEDPVFGAKGSLRNLWTRAGDKFWAEGELRAA